MASSAAKGSSKVEVQSGMKRENYSSLEKEYLIELVKERASVIENCQNSPLINIKKNKCWKEIACKFNGNFPTKAPSDTTKLRNLYRRLKADAKKEHSIHKKSLKKTGGGPPPPEPSTQSQALIEMCPNIAFELHIPFDDDSSMTTSPSKAMDSFSEVVPIEALDLQTADSKTAVTPNAGDSSVES